MNRSIQNQSVSGEKRAGPAEQEAFEEDLDGRGETEGQLWGWTGEEAVL